MSKQSARGLVRARWVVFALIAIAAVVFAVGPAKSFVHHDDARTVSVARSASQPGTVAPATRSRINASYGNLPLFFESNEGQTDSQVKYMARSDGYTLFLTSGEAVLEFASSSSPRMSATKAAMMRRAGGFSNQARRQHQLVRRQESVTVLRMHMIGGNPQAQATGADLLSSKSNYFIGSDRHNWHGGVANYARVNYRSVYPGVDLAYHGQKRQLEFDFIVAPGAAPAPILLGFTGARSIATDASGNLVLTSSAGNLTLHKPLAYQQQNGSRQPVDARFALKADNQVGFEIGSYDRNRELIIDPSLSYATYLGGTNEDVAFGIAADSVGNAYITGHTDSSAGFPGGNPPSSVFYSFVTKLDPTGTSVMYTTFMGGSNGDNLGAAIAVDSAGAAYVAGITTATNWPVSASAPQTTSGGGGTCVNISSTGGKCTDGIAFKLNSVGQMVYSTYVGGSNDDEAFGIAVDTASPPNAYITGDTFSTDFPVRNSLRAFNNGVVQSPAPSDAFVAKINGTGTAPFVYNTYLGGNFLDLGNAIVVDALGDAFVTGFTLSTDFPAVLAYKSTCGTDTNCNNDGVGNIYSDVFVTEVAANGLSFTYSTYVGGSSDDSGMAIALDSNGDVYVTGNTTADNLHVAPGDFPVTSGAFGSSYGDGNASAVSNGFVFKLNPTTGSSGLVYSSYLGGSTQDTGVGIAVDSSNNAYITGGTLSIDFPIVNSFQAILKGTSDAFVTQVDPNGALLYSSYIGGTGSENYDPSNHTFFGGAIFVNKASGNVYLTGLTTSSTNDFPVTAGVIQSTYGGNPFDAFVALVIPGGSPGFSVSAGPLSPTSVAAGGSASSTVTVGSTNGFNVAVTLGCTITPVVSVPPTCGFVPASPTPPANGNVTSTLTIGTSAPHALLMRPSNGRSSGVFYAMLLPVSGMALLGVGLGSTRSRRNKLFGFLILGLILSGLLLMPACGGGGGGGGLHGGTPAGTYNITVTGTANGVAVNSNQLSLTVN